MADPRTAADSQLRNVEARTGKTFAQLRKLIADSGLTKVGEQRAMLMQSLGLGYGDANLVALRAKEALAPASAEGDPLDAIYAGPKAALRPLHERLAAEIGKLGASETAPKKSYVSLRRKKQFAMVGPATKDSVEIGLNAKDLPMHARLKLQPPGSMCSATTRITSAAEVDALLQSWLRKAYDAAG